MPRSATTGVFARVSNSFSNPVFGTLIDPTDATAYFNDLDVGLNPPELDGPVRIINELQVGTTGTAAGLVTFLNATSGSISLSPPAGALGTQTLTIPDATDTLVGRDTTDTLTNKTLTSPTITGSLAITANTTSAFAVGPNGATNSSFTVDASAASAAAGFVVRGAATGGTVALGLTDPGANTSLTLNAKGTGTLAIGAISTGAVSIAKVTFTPPATGATITIPDGVTLTGPAASGTVMTLGNNETVTGVKTFGSAGAVGKLAIAGNTSGSTVLNATATASGTLTLPAATDTLVGKATTDTFTNKTFNSTGTGNVLQVSGVTVSAGQYPGETSTGSATAGNVGELVSSIISAAAPVSLTTSTTTNITSISLTAGDWDVWGNVGYIPAATTNTTTYISAINTTSATLPGTTQPDKQHFTSYPNAGQVIASGNHVFSTTIQTRLSLSGTTTVYLIGRADFTVSTQTAYGYIMARRRR